MLNRVLYFSFYEKKYAVFLRLFAHQREYQALMSQRWYNMWQRDHPDNDLEEPTNTHTGKQELWH